MPLNQDISVVYLLKIQEIFEIRCTYLRVCQGLHFGMVRY